MSAQTSMVIFTITFLAAVLVNFACAAANHRAECACNWRMLMTVGLQQTSRFLSESVKLAAALGAIFALAFIIA